MRLKGADEHHRLDDDNLIAALGPHTQRAGIAGARTVTKQQELLFSESAIIIMLHYNYLRFVFLSRWV